MSQITKFRARIICSGLVQGVGFRYYVFKHAQKCNLQGYAKNLFNGDVETVVEGNRENIEKLFAALQQGPSKSQVHECTIDFYPFEGELTGFDIL